jgi:hypothetical protein
VTEHPGDLARTATVSTPRQRTRELAPLGGDAHTTDAALVDSDLDVAFARCLRLDVANGDASIVTVRGYRSQLAVWVTWCADHGVDARTATPDDLKRYREDLVDLGRQPSTIAHKLNVLRRVYAAAVAAGLRADNPVTGLRAPRDRRAPEDFGFLSEVELTLPFRAVPRDDSLKHLRDRATARSTIAWCSCGPMSRRGAARLPGGLGPRARGCRRRANADRDRHLRQWPPAQPPRGVRHVVDGYLRQAKVKRPRGSNHALRHAGATLA